MKQMTKKQKEVQSIGTFGKLKVIKYIVHENNINSKWQCKCECGNTIYVSTTHLLQGIYKSCGCAKSTNNNLTKEKDIYSKYMYYKNKFGDTYFKTPNEFKKWYRKKDNQKTNPITNKLKRQWQTVKKNQNGDFLNSKQYYDFAYSNGYINDFCSIHKKNKSLPYSFSNIEYGIYYHQKYKTFFISTSTLNKLHIKYDKENKVFYGYFYSHDKKIITKKHENFEIMFSEYLELYKFHKGIDLQF